MWHQGTTNMEELRGREVIPLDKMDIDIRKPLENRDGLPPEILRRKDYNEAIQIMGLAPKLALTDNVDLQQSFDVKKLEVNSRPMVLRQESGVTIDKQRQGKRVAPPEVDTMEIADPNCVSQLGVTRKIAHKRMRRDEEKTDELCKRVQNDIEDLNIGFKEPPKPMQSFDAVKRHAQVKTRAYNLIAAINRVCQTKKLQPVTPIRMLFDEDLSWSDLDSPLEMKLVGSGTFGKVFSFKTKRGHRIIQKVLTPNQQGVTHPNELQVPLSFPNCSTITKVLGFSWDGENASIYQENAGDSLRELMQKPEERKFLQERRNTWNVLYGLFDALTTLHTHGIKHRDVKPENTCYDPESGQVRLIDFASSRTLQDPKECSLSGTTPEYLDPSVSKCIKFKCKPPPLTEKSDVWGAGMIALYIIKGGHPIILHVTNKPEYPQTKEAGNIRLNTVLPELAELTDPLPGFFLEHPDDPDMETLLRGCLSVDEGKRWTSHEALKFIKAKLNREASVQNCGKRVDKPLQMDTTFLKTKLWGAADNGDLGRNFNIGQDKLECPALAVGGADEVPQGVVTGFAMKARTAGTASAVQQLPPRSQLVTALTPQIQPLIPQKMRPSQAVEPVSMWANEEPEAGDADLVWLKEYLLAKKSPPPPQYSLNAKAIPAATHAPQNQATVARLNWSLGPARNVAATGNAGSYQQAAGFGQYRYDPNIRKRLKVMSPVADSPETSMTASDAGPQVVGLWGKVSPQQAQPAAPQHQPQVAPTAAEEPQGNIPLFLFSSDENFL